MPLVADHSLTIREAIILRLTAVAALTSLVPSVRIYGEQPPDEPIWPFIRYGLPTAAPYESSCGGGSDHAITIHVFARGPGFDAAAKIAAEVVLALGENTDLTLDSAVELNALDWIGTQYIRDSLEASDYHAIVQFTAQTLEGS